MIPEMPLRTPFQNQALLQSLGPLKEITNSSIFISSISYVQVKWYISISLGRIFFYFLQTILWIYGLRAVVAVKAVIANIYETFTIC